jgi:glycosyltransferase involved in cell wall biosynthesis
MGGMMSFITDILPYLSKDFEITLWGVSTIRNKKSEVTIHGNNYPLKYFSDVNVGRKIIPNIARVVMNISLHSSCIYSGDYDILYFHGIPLSLPFLIRKRKSKNPKVVNHIHGVTNPFGVHRNKLISNSVTINLYNRYRDWVVRRSDLILLASDQNSYEKYLHNFSTDTAKKIIYIPNFANTEIFQKRDKQMARKQLGLSPDQVILVYTGRLSMQKDPLLLLKSFSFLRNELNVNAQLFLIGEGELWKELEKNIKKMHLSPNVKLIGKRRREEIAVWLNAADVFVYTSFGNGFPVSLIEAGMCGLPIVSTDVTGVRDLVIDGHTGYLAKKRDYKDIAGNIMKALKNKEILSENILNLSGKFTIENIADRIKELFMEF